MKSKAIFLALLAFAFGAQARPVSSEEAAQAALAWGRGSDRLGVAVGASVERTEGLRAAGGETFYAVRMSGGVVFMSGDTRVEPVLAFSSDRAFRADDVKSPLRAMLNADVAARQGRFGKVMLTAGSQPSASAGPAEAEAEAKWARLLPKENLRLAAPNPVDSETQIDDLRVKPLLKTTWGQSTIYVFAGGKLTEANCFNYYTPQYVYVDSSGKPGSERCVCGCVATAMAQLMRYWRAPEGLRAAFSGSCSMPDEVKWSKSNGCYVSTTKPVTLTTQAGAYDWAAMVENPGYYTTEAQCQAIGKLTYDCGVSVGMNYDIADAGGSGIVSTDSGRIPAALREKFGYANAAIVTAGKGVGESSRIRAILPNLDAGRPVLLCIIGDGGHAVVADGYGYSYGETRYVHLNMGWQGQNDVWYNLPEINVSDNPESFVGFDKVVDVVYNVFPSEKGEIVSGRVLDVASKPVADATVEIRVAGSAEVLRSAKSGPNGIYSFVVPAGSAYELTARTDGLVSPPKGVSSLSDSTKGVTVGNSWGNDLVVDNPSVRIGEEIYGSLEAAFAAAKAGDVLTVFAATELGKDVTVGVDCTVRSEDPDGLQVVRTGDAKLTVAAGATLTVADVTFGGSAATLVEVAAGGRLVVGDGVTFGVPNETAAVVTEDAEGLTLAGTLKASIAVDCKAARLVGKTFARSTLDLETANAQAAKIVALFDRSGEVGGSAAEAGDGCELLWDYVPVPLENATAYYVIGTETNCFRRLDNLFAKLAAAEQAAKVVIVGDGTLSHRVALAHDVTIEADAAAGVTVKAEPDQPAGFDISNAAAVRVVNLSFAGMKGDSLFTVSGAGSSLSLEGSTEVLGFVGTKKTTSAAVRVTGGGRLSVGSKGGDVRFENCANQSGDQAKGGAVYVADANSTVVLRDGVTIADCNSWGDGGGVYVGSGAKVVLSGRLLVRGNTAGADEATAWESDIFCTSQALGVEVADLIERNSAVGILRRTTTGAFAKPAAGLTDKTKIFDSAEAFFCDGDDLVAKPSADYRSYVWAKPDSSVQPVDPEVAHVHVAGSATGYYASLEDALEVLGGKGGTLELLRDTAIAADLALNGTLTLKSAAGAAATLSRDGAAKFLVGNGAKVTVENLTLSGADTDGGQLVKVNGGQLTLGAGAVVTGVSGGVTRNDSAIHVINGGKLVIRSGARIADCENPYVYDHSENGRGGAVTVDGSSVRIEGGTIENCTANLGGGVFIGNQSLVEVGGNARIVENGDKDGRPGNVYVPVNCTLYLISPLTGAVGVTQREPTDPFVFGRLSAEFAGTDAQLADSAHKFVNDVNGDVGFAVRNGGETLLVWSDGLDAKGQYVVGGKTYVPVAGGATVTAFAPDVVEGLVYDATEQRGVPAGHGFVTEGTVAATDAGAYSAKLTPKAGFVWADGKTSATNLEWQIAKAQLKVTAEAAGKVQGEEDPALTYSVAGLQGDDAAETVLAGALAREPGEEPGEYAIGVGSLAVVGPNYELDFTGATFTITSSGPGPVEPVECPKPFYFTAIAEQGDGSWAVTISPVAKYCTYTLLASDDLETWTPVFEDVMAPADGEMTFEPVAGDGHRFWRALGKDGVRPQGE